MVYDKAYASIYDALYQDKDYEAECDFLQQIFRNHVRSPIRTVLDLGCGTGGHALSLMEREYAITGVDRSATMISEARWKLSGAQPKGVTQCEFIQGDICDLDLGCTYDAVIAMFAVIGYQTTNEDLAAAFHTAQRHLEPGGLFVFDCWYGPAVLAQKPTDRYRMVKRGSERIIRYARSVMDVLRHTVQVNYSVLRLRGDHVLAETYESHLVRFLFPKEIEYYLSEAGLKLLRLCSFMELDRDPTEHDWNITVVSTAL